MRPARLRAWGRSAVVLLAALPCVAWSQELEPRVYSPSPVGMNFAALSLSRSTGGVAVDPSLPIENVDARIDSAALGYVRTFDCLGRFASAGVVVPYAWGEVTGDVFEERRTAVRSGFADARLRFSVNLYGGPALDRRQFAQRVKSTQVGVAVTLVPPSGEYDSDQLINLGSNRWSVKPEIGVYQPIGPWSFELAAGLWLFGDNSDFYGGVRREQQPVKSLQSHVGYTVRPGLWAAVDYAYYWGGESTLDGVHKRDLQKSSRVGLTLSVPLSGGYSTKIAWSQGVATRIGADFTTYTVTLQKAW